VSIIEAFILGIIQGLTEFLPVSSSGHIELAKSLFGVNAESTLIFTIVVHGATVLSILFVFWKDIVDLIKGVFAFKLNEETIYVLKIAVSMIPVAFVGLFFKDRIESLFGGNNTAFVGYMLLITSVLLAITYFYRPKKTKDVNFLSAFIIGIAQAIAVLPGISRSGSTIATGLFLGVDKEKITKFSFLMVVIPVLGENFLDLTKGDITNSTIGITPLIVGFIAAFISGVFACRWMIKIVKNSKLIYFAIYTFIVGIIAILLG